MGETGLRLPVNPDAMPAIQQLRRENQQRKPRLPPLPPSYYKIVIRPRDGLDFSKWQSHRVARAVSQAAHITAAESDTLTLRIRNEQNLAVASTPKEELVERIRRITTLQLVGKECQVYAYVAAPDMSCKGVATGIDSETHPDELMANLRSLQAPILFARMLGKSTAALITFDGLEVPRTTYYYGGELLYRPYRPLSQVCSICLKTGHRADICPTPKNARCKNCGQENPSEDHQCQPKCVLCEGDHPVTDPSCPARQRKPLNKSHFLRNAGYTSDANNVPTTTNPGTSTNPPQTPGSKSPPASTETNVDRCRSPRRSTDSKKRDKSRDASTSVSQSLPRAKTPRHERHEATANEQGAESRSTIDMLEKSERKVVTKGPCTNPPKVNWAERLSNLSSLPSPTATNFPPLRTCTRSTHTGQVPLTNNFTTNAQVQEMINDIARTLRQEMRTLVNEMAITLRQELHQLKHEFQQDRERLSNEMQRDRQELRESFTQDRLEIKEEIKTTLQQIFIELTQEFRQQICDEVTQTVVHNATPKRTRISPLEAREDIRAHPYARPSSQASLQ
ncbi:hypothetical protein HPB49_005548 [Dermacentor silvarum]|uniref:Uncharacterized protein n=1 Tax=Dermacentor silvarum TaxID=543639 RepID=A0ACB8DVZ6_DERSI|nr:hypothetical protein HPB49_005548 [Dermacentor silvarum]